MSEANSGGKDPSPGKGKSQEQGGRAEDGKSYKQILLESLKGKAGKSASDWVEKLASDTQEALGRRTTLSFPRSIRTLGARESVTAWMDKIFDYFLDYAYDFNPAVAGTDLEVSWERPVVYNEPVRERKWDDPDKMMWIFKGSVSTRSWSLILRGTIERIHGYIVPKDKIIALSGSSISFYPYLEMVAVTEKGLTTWTVDDVEMPFERVHEVAEDLFGALIRVARGEQTADEKSHLHRTAQKAPPPIPHQSLSGRYRAFVPPPVDQTESMRISFRPDYVPKRDDLLRDSGGFRKAGAAAEAEKAATRSDAAQAKAAQPGEPAKVREAKAGADSPARAPAAAGATEAARSPEAARPPEAGEPPEAAKSMEAAKPPEPVQSTETAKRAEAAHSPPEVATDYKEMTAGQALDLLLRVVEQNLEQLARSGAEAFTRRDMKAAEEVLRRSSTLGAFKDQVIALSKQWKELL